jgi:hypothetical protein
MFRLFIALTLLAPTANAKSATWWDCYFREFELCPGGSLGKAACESNARTTCDEEERKRTPNLAGRRGNEKVGRNQPYAADTPGTPSREGDGVADAVVEGDAPSGDATVLGIDVRLSISEVVDRYKARNVRGCRPVEDAFTRFLCVDAPGGASAPIELEFYRGQLVSLRFEESDGQSSVSFGAATAVAEGKTGAKALIAGCEARFPVGGGTFTVQARAPGTDFACFETTPIARLEWRPGTARLREVAEKRKADRSPASAREEDVVRAKNLLSN